MGPNSSDRGLPGCFESVGCCLLVVEVGSDAARCHKGAGCALRSGFGPHNRVILGKMRLNSLRKAQPAPYGVTVIAPHLPPQNHRQSHAHGALTS